MKEQVANFHQFNQPFKIDPNDKKSKFIEPSWEDAEKYTKEAEKWAKVIEGLSQDLAKATNEMQKALFEAYRRAPVVDASFGASPVGNQKTIYAITSYLKKLGWRGIRGVHTPEVEIKDLTKVISDGCKWVLKLRDETN